jgi:hypothetical protein
MHVMAAGGVPPALGRHREGSGMPADPLLVLHQVTGFFAARGIPVTCPEGARRQLAAILWPDRVGDTGGRIEHP